MHGFLFALVLATALGAAVMGGVFYGFSVLVMKGLAQVPAPEAIRVMQAVNRSALTPAFMSVFMGTTLASGAVLVWSLVSWDGAASACLVAGSALYLVGSFALTAAYHVPRNEALDKADGTRAETLWQTYLPEWTRMNHVRGLASAVAGGLLVAALAVA